MVILHRQSQFNGFVRPGHSLSNRSGLHRETNPTLAGLGTTDRMSASRLS